MTQEREFFAHSDEGRSVAPFHYTRCGLPNVYLLNGFDRDEDEDFVSVRDVAGLHHAVGLHLVFNRKALSPAEIRFLRRTMDLTQSELGRKIGQSDQAIARWEKGRTEMPGPADRLLRVMFLDAFDAHLEGEHVLDFLDKIGNLDTGPQGKLEFCRDDREWANAVGA